MMAEVKTMVSQYYSKCYHSTHAMMTEGFHMGHTIFVALQDVLARFHRMRGRPVLWLPGKFSVVYLKMLVQSVCYKRCILHACTTARIV